MKYQSSNRTRLRFRNDRSPKRNSVVNVMCPARYANIHHGITLSWELFPNHLREIVDWEIPVREEDAPKRDWRSSRRNMRERDGIENRLIEQRGNLIEIYECGRAYMSKLHRDEWLFNDANVSCFTLKHKAARFGQNEVFPFVLSSLPFKVPQNAISTKGGTNSTRR